MKDMPQMGHSHSDPGVNGWVVCQLGAREHYAVPRSLSSRGKLIGMFTDAWVQPGNLLGTMRRRLRDRYHPDLYDARVGAANLSLLSFEAISRFKGQKGWQSILERNRWFQHRAIGWLKQLNRFIPNHSSDPPPVLFAYSYAARDLLAWARHSGWKTVLGQIDPGIEEERLMNVVCQRHLSAGQRWDNAPPEYWETWQQECDLADAIVVNSDWSRRMLIKAGVMPAKINSIPLVYSPSEKAARFERPVLNNFSSERPLRVLFLGQVTLRKGVMELLEAAQELSAAPLEILVVGPRLSDIPGELLKLPNVRLVGPVPRSQVDYWYQNADVFLFPTHSDGFGLTQLEAQAWGLPIVASRNCGDVVVHGENGLLLPDVSAAAITDTLLRLCSEPGLVARLARGQRDMRLRTLADFADDLIAVEKSLNRDVSVDSAPRETK